MRLLLSLIIITSTLPSFAQTAVGSANGSCLYKSIDTHDMPVNRDQGNLQWCFLWPAADLLSFYLKQKISVYDLGSQYFENYLDPSKKNIFSKKFQDELKKAKSIGQMGGNFVFAFMAGVSSSKGLCLEKDLAPSNLKDWDQVSKLVADLLKRGSSVSANLCTESFQDTFSAINQQIAQILDKLSVEKKFQALMDVQCTNRYRAELRGAFLVQSVASKKGKLNFTELDKNLDSGQPAVINYDSQLIRKGKKQKIKTDHSSTIIGRRFNRETNNCEYLIRNSWGENCNPEYYDNKLECEKESGNIWVSKKSIEKYASGYQYIYHMTEEDMKAIAPVD